MGYRYPGSEFAYRRNLLLLSFSVPLVHPPLSALLLTPSTSYRELQKLISSSTYAGRRSHASSQHCPVLDQTVAT